jgi:hypothetical protein
MKKLLAILIVATASVSAFAQDFKPFRVGLGLGYASPGGEGAKGGVLFYLEPSYRVSDAIAVGLRMEGAVMARGTVITGVNSSAADLDVAANGSYTLNGQYYFMNGGFRPFAGMGFGLYSLASTNVKSVSTGNTTTTTSGTEVSGGTKFGFYPRVGFDAGHFSFNIEYNIIPATKSTVLLTSGNGTITTADSEVKNSYLGVKLGFFIGGGRRS